MREAREELGIDAKDAELIDKYEFTSDREHELIFAHKITCTSDITPSAETDGGRFWAMQEIRDAIGKDILTPNFEQEFIRLFSEQEQ